MIKEMVMNEMKLLADLEYIREHLDCVEESLFGDQCETFLTESERLAGFHLGKVFFCLDYIIFELGQKENDAKK